MKIPKDLKYTKTHEWVRINGNTITCGITDYAQSELSDIVFVELSPVGYLLEKSKPFGTIEAVKAVSDLYSPVTGKIVQVNEKLASTPELVNNDPYGEGWMVRIELANPAELNEFLSPEEYEQFITEGR